MKAVSGFDYFGVLQPDFVCLEAVCIAVPSRLPQALSG